MLEWRKARFAGGLYAGRAKLARTTTEVVDVRAAGGYNPAMSANRGQCRRQRGPKPRDAVAEAIAYGIDVAALRDNLARTPAERLRRHQIALDTVEMLRKAKRV